MDIFQKPKSVKHYQDLLKHKDWRLNNLYWIKDKNGKRVKFRMKPEQWEVHKNRHSRNIILKARQLGMTTYLQIDYLDECLFTPNTSAGIIAHNKDDAQFFFKEKIKYAYDNLPKHVKDSKPADTNSAGTLRFENGSVIRVGTSLRSGTYQRLHVSEYGKLCALFPERAREARTGAMETVPSNGIIDIESTAEGAMGDFYDKCEIARKLQEEKIKPNPLEYKFFFFPWQNEADYSLDAEPLLSDMAKNIFALYEKRGIELTKGQKAFWIGKKSSLKGDMGREYPTYWQEAFEAEIEGAYFARQMTQIRAKGHITSVPIERGIPIETFWDLGRDTTAIWFFQRVGFDYRFCDYFSNSGEDMAYYVQMLKDREDAGEYYNYGTCHLPHDGNRKSLASNDTPQEVLYRNGFDVTIVERTKDKSLSIEHARQQLPKCWFDRERCQEGIACLDAYRKEKDEKMDTWKKTPRHDAASHGCLVAGSMIETPSGPVAVQDIKPGHSVSLDGGTGRVTHAGYVKTCETLRIKFSDGAEIECSPEHKFFTECGLVMADALVHNTAVSTRKVPLCNMKKLFQSSDGLRAAFTQNIQESSIGSGKKEDITFPKSAGSNHFSTGFCGKDHAAKSNMAILSILLTEIGVISRRTTGKVSNAALATSARENTSHRNTGGLVTTSAPTDITNQRLIPGVNSSIAKSGKTIMGKFLKTIIFITRTATRRIIDRKILSACLPAPILYSTPLTTNGLAVRGTRRRYERPEKNLKHGTPLLKGWSGTESTEKARGPKESLTQLLARFAAMITRLTGREEARFVAKNAVRVIGVEKTGIVKPVYDITVDRHHAYYVGGVLTSNSDAFMTFADGYFYEEEEQEAPMIQSGRNATTGY